LVTLSSIVAAVLVVCSSPAAPAAATAPTLPGISAQFDPLESTRFAIEDACLPAVRDSQPGAAPFKRLFRLPKSAYPDQAAYLIGAGVTINTDGRSCTVRAQRGPSDRLRQVVLDGVAAGGAKLVVVMDSGAEGRDSAGRFRQELYCLTFDRQRAALLISTSPERNRVPLQATIRPATEGPCAGPDPAN
jgi:hypothetical protein